MIKEHNRPYYETDEYDLFKLSKKNRPVISTKWLEKNIEKKDYTEYRPILVSRDYTIIDGQHRFFACKNLNKPIFFVYFEGPDEIEDVMITLNRYQKNWTYEDFVDYYAKNGEVSYQDFLKFLDENGMNFSQGYLVYSNKEMKSIVKSGTPIEKREKADDIADFLNDENVKKYKMARMTVFTRAIIEVFKTYSPKQIKRLTKYMGAIKQCANIEQYLGYFEKYKGNR